MPTLIARLGDDFKQFNYNLYYDNQDNFSGANPNVEANDSFSERQYRDYKMLRQIVPRRKN